MAFHPTNRICVVQFEYNIYSTWMKTAICSSVWSTCALHYHDDDDHLFTFYHSTQVFTQKQVISRILSTLVLKHKIKCIWYIILVTLSNTKLKMAGIYYGSTSSESTHPKWKQNSCTVEHELVLPEKVVRTAPDSQNVECLSNAKIFIPTRSKLSASLVSSTCIRGSNRGNFSKRTVKTPSAMRRICGKSKTGGTYCIARWCGNNAKKTPGISLFRIPKDPDRALLWLTNAEREDLKILSMESLHTKYLCMEHFNEDMFMNSCKKKLVWNALPTHFPKPDYALRKEYKNSSHHRQLKSNTSRTAKRVALSRRRPLRPKPLPDELSSMAKLNSQPDTYNAEELKSVTVKVSSLHSVENRSQIIKKEQSTMKEVQTLKVKINDNNAVPKCQNILQLSVQGSSMVTQPNTKNLATQCQKPVGHTETANIIICSNLNEIVGLKEDKLQSVTSTCDYLSLRNTDSVLHEGDHGDSSAVGEINKSNVTDESYLTCDVDSLCLEHAFQETNERIYPCRYCGEMFLVKSNLVLHQTTYHSDHPVGCELCGKVLYKSRSEFMEHVCEHHSDNSHS